MRKRNLLIILGIITLITACYLYYSGYLFMNGITPCFPPPTMAVDGVAGGKVFTWIDQNRNGFFETGEEPLSNVEILRPFSMEPVFTDGNGSASAYEFRPGCVCKCWEGEIMEVKKPEGFCNTTPLVQKLTGDDAIYQFGFFEDVSCAN
jgi:hypothetical protein